MRRGIFAFLAVVGLAAPSFGLPMYLSIDLEVTSENNIVPAGVYPDAIQLWFEKTDPAPYPPVFPGGAWPSVDRIEMNLGPHEWEATARYTQHGEGFYFDIWASAPGIGFEPAPFGGPHPQTCDWASYGAQADEACAVYSGMGGAWWMVPGSTVIGLTPLRAEVIPEPSPFALVGLSLAVVALTPRAWRS